MALTKILRESSEMVFQDAKVYSGIIASRYVVADKGNRAF